MHKPYHNISYQVWVFWNLWKNVASPNFGWGDWTTYLFQEPNVVLLSYLFLYLLLTYIFPSPESHGLKLFEPSLSTA